MVNVTSKSINKSIRIKIKIVINIIYFIAGNKVTAFNIFKNYCIIK